MLIRKLLIASVVFAFSSLVFAQFKGDGSKDTVVGSKHDLNSQQGQVTNGGGAVCEFCHAPHKFNGAGGATPLLWNVTVKTGTTFKTYDQTGSPTFDSGDTIRNPGGASSSTGASYMTLLCLSCHDGSITDAAWYQKTAGMGGDNNGFAISISPPNVGEDGTVGLQNDHPVDFVYSVNLATADGGLKSPTEGAGQRFAYVPASSPLPLFKDTAQDVSGRVECATCHNPHNSTNDPFLRIANTASALCLACHSTK